MSNDETVVSRKAFAQKERFTGLGVDAVSCEFGNGGGRGEQDN